jgi:hypothetical protein
MLHPIPSTLLHVCTSHAPALRQGGLVGPPARHRPHAAAGQLRALHAPVLTPKRAQRGVGAGPRRPPSRGEMGGRWDGDGTAIDQGMEGRSGCVGGWGAGGVCVGGLHLLHLHHPHFSPHLRPTAHRHPPGTWSPSPSPCQRTRCRCTAGQLEVGGWGWLVGWVAGVGRAGSVEGSKWVGQGGAGLNWWGRVKMGGTSGYVVVGAE